MASTYFYAALIVATFFSLASVVVSQAPGDFEKKCDHEINYPNEWKVLFDSNRYVKLVKKWEIMDFDNDFKTVKSNIMISNYFFNLLFSL